MTDEFLKKRADGLADLLAGLLGGLDKGSITVEAIEGLFESKNELI